MFVCCLRFITVGRSLANSLQEIKAEFCPYCEGWAIQPSEYQLKGSTATITRNNSVSSTPGGGGTATTSSATSLSTSPVATSPEEAMAAQQAKLPLSRRASLTTSVHDARKLSRSANMAGNSDSYDLGPVAEAKSRNAELNARVQSYVIGGCSEGGVCGAENEGDEEDIQPHSKVGETGDVDDDGIVKMPGKIRHLSSKLANMRLGRRKG
jgi:hypothetical protein